MNFASGVSRVFRVGVAPMLSSVCQGRLNTASDVPMDV